MKSILKFALELTREQEFPDSKIHEIFRTNGSANERFHADPDINAEHLKWFNSFLKEHNIKLNPNIRSTEDLLQLREKIRLLTAFRQVPLSAQAAKWKLLQVLATNSSIPSDEVSVIEYNDQLVSRALAGYELAAAKKFSSAVHEHNLFIFMAMGHVAEALNLFEFLSKPESSDIKGSLGLGHLNGKALLHYLLSTQLHQHFTDIQVEEHDQGIVIQNVVSGIKESELNYLKSAFSEMNNNVSISAETVAVFAGLSGITGYTFSVWQKLSVAKNSKRVPKIPAKVFLDIYENGLAQSEVSHEVVAGDEQKSKSTWWGMLGQGLKRIVGVQHGESNAEKECETLSKLKNGILHNMIALKKIAPNIEMDTLNDDVVVKYKTHCVEIQNTYNTIHESTSEIRTLITEINNALSDFRKEIEDVNRILIKEAHAENTGGAWSRHKGKVITFVGALVGTGLAAVVMLFLIPLFLPAFVSTVTVNTLLGGLTLGAIMGSSGVFAVTHLISSPSMPQYQPITQETTFSLPLLPASVMPSFEKVSDPSQGNKMTVENNAGSKVTAP